MNPNRARQSSEFVDRLKGLPVPAQHNPGPAPYYTTLDRPQACDFIVRCDDCKALVTADVWHATGACQVCGNHQFREIRTLSVWEWVKIRVGLIDFPHRKLFLAEFSSKGRPV